MQTCYFLAHEEHYFGSKESTDDPDPLIGKFLMIRMCMDIQKSTFTLQTATSHAFYGTYAQNRYSLFVVIDNVQYSTSSG